jgi:HEPN domain-containing protein
LLKGLLVGCGVVVPRTHDLERLAHLLGTRVPEVSTDMQRLVVLSPWAEVTRYPQLDSDAGVSDEDVRQAIADLEKLSEKASTLAARLTSGGGMS